MGSATSNLLNQVSTDLDNPPAFSKTKVSRPLDVPLQKKLHPEVKPLELSVDAGRAFREALRLAHQDFTVVADDAGEGTIECSDTTRIMRYVDDIVIRVSDLGGGKCRVDMRSASRVGKSDLGKNAQRVQTFLGKLKATAASGA